VKEERVKRGEEEEERRKREERKEVYKVEEKES